MSNQPAAALIVTIKTFNNYRARRDRLKEMSEITVGSSRVVAVVVELTEVWLPSRRCESATGGIGGPFASMPPKSCCDAIRGDSARLWEIEMCQLMMCHNNKQHIKQAHAV